MNRFCRNFAVMNQKSSHKVFSLIMAFCVLLSTISFTMEKHFCGETLIDVAIFSNPDTCGMDMGFVSDKETCCKNELEIVKGQDKLKKASFEDFTLQQQFFIISLVYSYKNLFEGFSIQNIPHKNYTPPKLVADINILDQVFII